MSFGRFPDVWHALEAIHAYDAGATDSGVRDEELRAECAAAVLNMPLEDFRLGISRFVRDAYLSDEGLEAGYGAADAAEFFRWVFDGDFRRG